jgi:hypothetical protein
MGLTGLILSAEIQLKKIQSPAIVTETVKCRNLEEFFSVDDESIQSHEYTVAWMDTFAKGAGFGRALYHRANHSLNPDAEYSTPSQWTFSIPKTGGCSPLHPLLLKAFNFLLYQKQRAPITHRTQHYDPFFFPLDKLENWNRLYGKNGLLQYQCVIPKENAKKLLMEIIKKTQDIVGGSYLCVVKSFGDLSPAGLMSFPREGFTIAMDFPINNKSLHLCEVLDDVVARAAGQIYLAKDSRLSKERFQEFFPEWIDFSKWVDPKFSSDLWRRVCPTQ